LGGAVMSEIFYRSGLPTERCLAVIAYPDRTAVGVRTAPNLIRPAHLFRYLKLGMHKELKLSLDYFLSRQIENKVFPGSYKGKEKYQKSLEYFAKTYAKLCAVMEEEYIFNWLAWDGDNMLASGGILDYGSIRRFAAKHDKYRYEDTDRFSTCLTEQRLEARRIVQTFAQVIDFVITGKKKNLKKFERHQSLRFFDQSFEEEVHNRMLWRMGFEPHQIYKLLTKHPKKVQEFRKVLNYFEGIKSVKGEVKLPDGIDHPPIFLVRHILRELPNFIIQNKDKDRWPIMPPEGFCHVLLASYVDRQDMVLNDTRKQKSLHYQLLFRELIKLVGGDEYQILYKIAERSSVINYENRSTGDGLTWIINEAIKHMDKMKQDEFQETIERFILSQVLTPGEWNPISPGELKGSSMSSRLLRKMHEQLQMYNEMI
ncbi:MAG: YdiU family protein, partial [Candidatus Omnitrophica bacterium]|nr:YdiU family protein [Candidatus Omnitrophota bacterium]